MRLLFAWFFRGVIFRRVVFLPYHSPVDQDLLVNNLPASIADPRRNFTANGIKTNQIKDAATSSTFHDGIL
jgi:hypothetical protein